MFEKYQKVLMQALTDDIQNYEEYGKECADAFKDMMDFKNLGKMLKEAMNAKKQ